MQLLKMCNKNVMQKVKLVLMTLIIAILSNISIGHVLPSDLDIPKISFSQNNSSDSKVLMTQSSQTPRGSTYSYYYISRRVWYIPLWFLIYFCLYILGLIIRSIILHRIKANPTELTNGRFLNVFEVSSNSDSLMQLTSKIVNFIETFQGGTEKIM